MKRDWEIKALGEIADVEYGFTDKSTNDGDYRYVRITDIDNNGELIPNEKKYIKYSKEAEGFLLHNNDLLMARTGATFAKVLIYENVEPSIFASYLIRINFKEKIENKLYWYFSKTKSYWEQANSLASGAAQPHFNGAAVKQIIFPYPKSPHEQQRIVSILDEAFTAIATAKANAEQNLKNARELFESYLQSVFEKNDEEYEDKKFEDVCDLIGGSQPPKDDFIYEAKDGYIRLIQVRDYRTDKYITYIPTHKAKRFCSKEDIMIGRYGPPIFGIFKGIEGSYNVALMKAEVNKKICDSDYFYWFLKTNKLREFVEKSSKRAAGQDGIRKELLDKYPVPIPKLSVQKKIAQNVVALSIETKKLESIYKQKIEDLEELKKSVLQKAFSGELKSPEGVLSVNDGHSPSKKQATTKKSPIRAK